MTTRQSLMWPTYLTILVVAFCGCGEPPKAETDDPETASRMQSGFSWVVEDKLCGMPLPGVEGDLPEDLAYLESQGIDLLVSLTADVPGAEQLQAYGIESLHIPIPDYHAPTMEQLDLFVSEVKARATADERVGVHCKAGLGRTGTFLAAYFVSEGMEATDAIAKIREIRPGSVETEAQEAAIAEFYSFINED